MEAVKLRAVDIRTECFPVSVIEAISIAGRADVPCMGRQGQARFGAQNPAGPPDYRPRSCAIFNFRRRNPVQVFPSGAGYDRLNKWIVQTARGLQSTRMAPRGVVMRTGPATGEPGPRRSCVRHSQPVGRCKALAGKQTSFRSSAIFGSRPRAPRHPDPGSRSVK